MDTTDPVDCAVCGAPVRLDDRTTVGLRHLSGADASALGELYSHLSRNDLHRRFFTGAHVPPRFFDQWASISESGGFGLGAEVTDSDGNRLVGEAGYALRADGDGELGMAVRPGFRGWLGPWMLDALVRHAAERGIPNIQAVVLVENRAMLALTKRRGSAVLGHPDWGIVRLTIGTSGAVPTFPGPHDRPRILIESERTRWIAEEELTTAGFDVAVCTGVCDPNGHCPVLAGAACPLVDGADAVIVDLPPNDPRALALIRAERVVHPAVRHVAGYAVGESGVSRHRTAAEILAEIGHLVDRPDESI